MKFRRILAGLGALALLLAAAPTAQAADDYLVVSDPEPHAELQDRPGWVTLVFASPAGASYAAIVVQNAAGENVTIGGLIVEGTNVTTQLVSGLPKGTYTVIYRTEGADGGPRGGAFQFAYGPGAWTDVKDVWIGEEEQPPEIDDPGPPPSSLEPVETETPEPTETPTESASPTESSSPTDSASLSPSESPVAPPPGEGSNPTGWIVGIGAAVAAVAVGGVLVARRKRGSHEAR